MPYLIAILIIIGLYLIWKQKIFKQNTGFRMGPDIGEKFKNKKLRQLYRQKAKLPPHRAEEIINLHIKKLEEKNPGRTEEWYLEKMLYDLERDIS